MNYIQVDIFLSKKQSFADIITAKLNEIDFEIGDVSKIGNRQFDIVLANINRNIILNNLQSYSNALNSIGHIILSGFYSKDEALIINNTKDIGLKLLNKNVKENWLLLHFQK